MYCLISTFNKTFDELGLIYFIPSFLESEIKQGMIVEVPIGKKIEIGVVLQIGTLENLNILEINETKIKSIISVKNNNIFLNQKQIELVQFIAKYYFTPIHNSLSLFFPKNLREKIIKNKVKFPLPPFLKGDLKKNEKKGSSSPLKKGIIGEFSYTFNFNKKLSKKQEDIFENINNSEERKFLLHGITGSGKTEIYIKLIKEQLDSNKQSLLLIPEIILTNQLVSRLKQVFGDNIITINSSITEANKTKAWLSIFSGNSKIIIGTRSALFYPYNNLGLIIIDEEHDNSYISDQAPRYNSIEIANKITNLNGNKLLLASGTPSIKSMYLAIKGKYKLLKLLDKFDK